MVADDSILIQLSGVVMRFNGIVALDQIDMDLRRGKITGLIGPNGAGKSTLLNCINGLYHPDEGSIMFDGREVTKLKVHQIASAGVARTFQHAGLVESLTVRENIELGGYWQEHSSLMPRCSDVSGVRRSRQQREERLHYLLEKFELSQLADKSPSELPQGLLRNVEVARSLMEQPEVLLLDEPAAGLTHGESESLASKLREIHEETELTMVVVEHNMGVIERMCDEVQVLHLGKNLFAGTPAQVAASGAVIEAYLGVVE